MMRLAYMAQYLPRLTETFVYREIKALRKLGHEIITLSVKTPDPAELSAESIDIFHSTQFFVPVKIIDVLLAHAYFLFTRPWRYLSTFCFVMTRPGESLDNRKRTLGHFAGAVYHSKLVQKQEIQHIHAHFSGNPTTYAFIISQLLNITFSFTAHNSLFTDQLILRQKIKASLFIISISEYTRHYIENFATGIENVRQKIHVVHCGIDPDQFQPRDDTAMHQTKPPLIFIASRMEPRKGLCYLVEACHILQQRGIDFRCVIGGEGREMAQLKSDVAKYQLADHIKFPGFILQEELGTWYEKTAILPLPCIKTEDGDVDGIPVTLMEAMAKQIPVISTPVSGIPELIQSGHNGLLVPPKDALALADALTSLLQDQEEAQRLGRNGRNTIQDKFSIHKNSLQLSHIFTKYVQKSAVPLPAKSPPVPNPHL